MKFLNGIGCSDRGLRVEIGGSGMFDAFLFRPVGSHKLKAYMKDH